jgi:hypothetical protein
VAAPDPAGHAGSEALFARSVQSYHRAPTVSNTLTLGTTDSPSLRHQTANWYPLSLLCIAVGPVTRKIGKEIPFQ